MGWLGRIVGTQPPKVPSGGRAYVSMDDMDGNAWSVRVVMGDASLGWRDERISPTFALQTTAYAYLDWIEGGPKFVYPEGKA